ncbi:DUF3427 domain-containing protein [Synechococcus sp. CS-205]|uniref:DUF3427 domain-containing protein n=1 Tax=Synechococcus sp. CS-205 TaxID=2847984 RepID=UPI00223AF8D9|nr:DUF3427 domain-containing protein [Synechococcus sp. CS-205]MCT0247734.1 DUF3427 domain-containing protein [Synechococcus sp. CS-205]
MSSERVLANLRESLPSRRPQLLAECRRLGRCSLAALLDGLGMELGEFYRVAGSWALLQRELGWVAGVASGGPTVDEERLGRGVGRLLHLDDTDRLSFLLQGLAHGQPPVVQSLSGTDRLALQDALDRLWACPAFLDELRDLCTLLLERTDHLAPPLVWDQPVPLALHARYSRAEIYAAFGLITDTQQTTGQSRVLFDRATQCDVFFITLKKSERLFSATTRYNDYAISPWEFHWESQSNTREASATGQRYIHHRERGSRVLLFVREENKQGGVTLPFLCLGFAEYVSHEGERPMAIRWRLQRPIPGALYPELAVAV